MEKTNDFLHGVGHGMRGEKVYFPQVDMPSLPCINAVSAARKPLDLAMTHVPSLTLRAKGAVTIATTTMSFPCGC